VFHRFGQRDIDIGLHNDEQLGLYSLSEH
jgi:hypothetical protein